MGTQHGDTGSIPAGKMTRAGSLRGRLWTSKPRPASQGLRLVWVRRRKSRGPWATGPRYLCCFWGNKAENMLKIKDRLEEQSQNKPISDRLDPSWKNDPGRQPRARLWTSKGAQTCFSRSAARLGSPEEEPRTLDNRSALPLLFLAEQSREHVENKGSTRGTKPKQTHFG
jgi:hypothetical protein